jgi:hypothetical protein
VQRSGWRWFGLWALPGAALAFQVSVIGLLLLPFGFVGALLLVKRVRLWPEVLGLSQGFAGIFLLFAYANRDYLGCDDERIALHPGELFPCHGTNPVIWLCVGLGFSAAGIVAYAALRRRASRRA